MPGKFHGQRSLAGYSPWGCKELDTTERLSAHARTGELRSHKLHGLAKEKKGGRKGGRLWAPQYGGACWSPSGLLGNPRPDCNNLSLHPGKMVPSHWKMLPSSAEQQGGPEDHEQSLQHGGPSCLGPCYKKCGKCHWRWGIGARGVLIKRLSGLGTQSEFSAEPSQCILEKHSWPR